MSTDYGQQDRGDAEAYERYLNGMDRSMRQKVALTAAHLLAEGTVADMGMGSGSGTVALASLYPRMKVVGVDVNPEMVERAQARYQLPNLSFVAGDIAAPVFAPGSLDGIFDSSVLHHVTSFNGYDHEAAARCLAAQAAELSVGGSLIVRDFVAPEPGTVLLDLPADDGDQTDDPGTCCSANLFERFAREFRPLSPSPGFGIEIVADAQVRSGWRRYRLEHRLAAEFLLRKDYRHDWASEVLEEYTYFTQRRFEREYAALGLRLLASIPIHNPWIVKHRFVGRAELRSEQGELLDFPATNLLVVGEKVAPSVGVRFEAGAEQPATGFLKLHCFRHVQTGSLRDLVRRPGTTLDVIPWFEVNGALFVLARKGHPRPILQTSDAAPALDGASPVGYVTEPILAVQSDKPLGLTADSALERSAGIAPSSIKEMVEASRYYPSPGGLVEQVQAVLVEIEPTYLERQITNPTGFSTSGSVRAIEACQLLRGAQVGALPDARLELNVYELLLRRGLDVGPWIGEQLELQPAAHMNDEQLLTDFTLPRRRSYVEVTSEADAAPAAGYLTLKCREFAELSASGEVLHRHPREYVLPEKRSTNTLACALLRRSGDQILLALDQDDLPAAQCFDGSSSIWVTPAWRVPRDVTRSSRAKAWVAVQLRAQYGVEVVEQWELGGRYYPSAGTTPETVTPLAIAVGALSAGKRALEWAPLLDVVRQLQKFPDGHLRIVALRAAHALGLLSK